MGGRDSATARSIVAGWPNSVAEPAHGGIEHGPLPKKRDRRKCFRNVQETRAFLGAHLPPSRRVRPARPQRKRPDAPCASGLWGMPDNDLLSHGETPHYHRRRAVSLLSSGWDQVVPTRYDRQANCARPTLTRQTGRNLMKRNCAPDCTSERTTNRGPNSFGLGYMVKPHGQLVRVSSTPHNAYTSRLSTS